ncbi:TetR/AcrR family transcriptional regulator [Streptomyces sp. NPDC050560]|uniref:TetR/AcrR family transcriptional regulator n=1 Tax=Streptomyces sp. NPDC050560 TaxID=3365630 RepID=UPI00378D95E5
MPRALRERQMLDAAVRTFGRHGYRAASMDDIAELAGVSKPLVYLYLDSKESLFTACVRREARALVGALCAGADPGLAPQRRLWEGLLAFFTHTARHPDGWSVLHQQARTHGEPFATEAVVMRRAIVDHVTALIAAALQEAHQGARPCPGELAGLAHALVGAAESLAEWAAAGPVPPERAAGMLMNLAWNGLDRLAAGHAWTPPDP